MCEIGARKEVKSDELDRIIKSSFTSPIAILERRFCAANEQPDFFNHLSALQGQPSDWDKGRVFDDKSEIRWEREQEGFHLVWIKDNANISGGWKKKLLKLIGEREILLWGERIVGKDEWFEKQVPRILEYPAKGSDSRAYAVLNEYKIVEDDSKIYRFKEVKLK